MSFNMNYSFLLEGQDLKYNINKYTPVDNSDFLNESSYKSEMDSMINEVKNGMKNFAKEASQYSHEFETDMKRSDYWDPDIIPSAPSYQFEPSRFEPTRFR